MSEIQEFYKDPLGVSDGIYHYFREDDVTEAWFMIIGPPGTPYENGFYFFHFKFPSNYPFEPPHVTFCTKDSKMRFNPNLYVDGKVCLSIINTWSGPGWTSCMSARTIVLALRALVLGTANPLQNEPGFEHCITQETKDYNNIILHENFRVSVCKMLQDPPLDFEVFHRDMLTYVRQNQAWYEANLIALECFNEIKINVSVYELKIKCNYTAILKKFNSLLKQKKPLANVKCFAIGDQVTSPWDDRVYVAKIVGVSKRWILAP